MFDDMEKLKQLVQNIEFRQNDTDDNDDDTEVSPDALFIDTGFGTDNLNSDPVIAHISGSASNVKNNKDAIFGSENDDNLDNEDCDKIMEFGLGNSFKIKKEFAKMECNYGLGIDNPRKIGDFVHHTDNIPVVFIVKNTDGPMITVAKPTKNEKEYATNQDGVWPEYHFDDDELETMDTVSPNQIHKVILFNDSPKMEAFNNSVIDDEPMKKAHEQRSENAISQVSDFFEDVFGAPYSVVASNKNAFGNKKYTDTTPQVICKTEPKFFISRGW